MQSPVLQSIDGPNLILPNEIGPHLSTILSKEKSIMDAIPFDYSDYQPKGDKKNSDFFEEYLPRIYTRRKESGVDDLLSIR